MIAMRVVKIFFLLLPLMVTSVVTPNTSSGASQQPSGRARPAGPRARPSQPEGQVIRRTPDQVKEQQKAAIVLLDRAPVLDGVEGKLEDDEFINLTRAVTLSQKGKIQSIEQSIKALEELIKAVGNPTATLKSNPEKNDVLYRRAVDDSAPWQSATTNTQVSVRPALYVFRCTDRKTGITKEKTQSCTGDCTVEFDF